MSETALTVVPQAPVALSAIPRSIFTMSAEQVNRLTLIAEMMATCQLSYSKVNNKPASKGDLFVIMLKGVEIGLEPLAAMDTISIIAGKPTLSPQGMLALINRSGELEDLQIVDDGQVCHVTMKRKGRTAHTESFGVEDATRMTTTEWENGNKRTIPLAQKHNWVAQPRTMRKWRAVAACARVVFPDIIQGLYTPEELDPAVVVDDMGEIVAQPTMTPLTPQLPAHPPTPTTTQQTGQSGTTETARQRAEAWLKGDGMTAAMAAELHSLTVPTDDNDAAAWKAFCEAYKAAKQPAAPPATPTPQPQSFTWNRDAEDVMDNYANDHFDLSRGEAMKLLNMESGKWSAFPTLEAAKRALDIAVSNAGLPVIARTARYSKTGTLKKVEFFVGSILNVELFGRDKLRDLGEDWKAAIETWQTEGDNLNHTLLAPVRITYTRVDGNRLRVEKTDTITLLNQPEQPVVIS